MTEIKHISCNHTVIEYDKSMIYVIENILDDALCCKIIEIINKLNLIKYCHSPNQNVECFAGYLDKLLKMDHELYYEFSTDNNKYNELKQNIITGKSIYTNQCNGIMKTTLENLYNNMNIIMCKIKEIMANINPLIDFDTNSNYILRKIYGETCNHIDNISEIHNSSNVNFIKEKIRYNNVNYYVRSASIVFTLNDDYDGGIFSFPYYNVEIKLKKGSVIIFPPYWTHEHRVSKMENNTFRYTISTWSYVKM